MPFLNEQITLINNALTANVLTVSRFQDSRIEALAIDVTSKDSNDKIQVFPCVMDKNYEPLPIVIDDTYSLIIYHKCLNKSYQPDPKTKPFGDGNKYTLETSNIKMVVYGKYSKIKITREQLEGLITANFPDNFTAQDFSPVKIDGMIARVNGSNFNSAALFAEEYKNTQYFLAPEDIFFSINYTIEARFRKGCIQVCDC